MRQVFLAAACSIFAGQAFAASVTVSDYSAAAYNAALGGGTYTLEDFETYNEGNVPNGFATNVGTFSAGGGTGTGGTISRADFLNNGNLLAVRDGNVFGRVSTTANLSGNPNNDQFLDSNDTFGILWDVDTGSPFKRIVLTLTDAAEFSRTILTIGGTDVTSEIFSGFGGSSKKIVEIEFDTARNSASLFFTHNRLNDGFSLDDIAVSEVPLPASILFLLGGLGGLSLLRRKSA